MLFCKVEQSAGSVIVIYSVILQHTCTENTIFSQTVDNSYSQSRQKNNMQICLKQWSKPEVEQSDCDKMFTACSFVVFNWWTAVIYIHFHSYLTKCGVRYNLKLLFLVNSHWSSPQLLSREAMSKPCGFCAFLVQLFLAAGLNAGKVITLFLGFSFKIDKFAAVFMSALVPFW